MKSELLDDSLKCFYVGNADQDDGRRGIIIRALWERVGHLECGVICLHELLCD